MSNHLTFVKQIKKHKNFDMIKKKLNSIDYFHWSEKLENYFLDNNSICKKFYLLVFSFLY